MKKTKKQQWVYQRKKLKVFCFTIKPVFEARRQKKSCMKLKTTVLPTKGSKCLLLHYQPSFPGEKTKKSHTWNKKKQYYQQKETSVFFFTINLVSQARRQKKVIHERKKNSTTNKRKQVPSTSLSTQFPRREDKKSHVWNKKKQFYQQKETSAFYFTINPVPQAKRQKKSCMKQKKTGLPTKGSTCLLLHYQPSFPGEKSKQTATHC